MRDPEPQCDRLSDTVWSLRLDFGSGSVAVAVGGHDLTVESDELVVISDPLLARSFGTAQAGDA